MVAACFDEYVLMHSHGDCLPQLAITNASSWWLRAQVPDVLAPFGGAVTPIVENILSTDLKRFARLAEQQQA